MSDYRLEYTCLVYILFLYDEDEKWERILIDNNFDFHNAIEVLIKKLEDIVKYKSNKINSNNNEGLEVYSTALKKAREIYD